MPRKRTIVTVFAAVVAVGVVAATVTTAVLANQGANPSGSGADLPTATDSQLTSAATTRVYFGHQSVGENVVDGMTELYADRGIAPPAIVVSSDALDGEGAVFEHSRIGTNGDPSGKIREFDSIIRSGVGDRVDVAMMKLCYVDVTSDTDVDALFQQYRDTMAKLQRDYPDVMFIHVTTPVTTDRTMGARAKAMVGRADNFPPENNAARERYNAMLRQEYGGSAPIFDLAAIQSTTPDGARLEGSVNGQAYYAMVGEYASDPGHLNERGSLLAAEGLVAVIASNATD